MNTASGRRFDAVLLDMDGVLLRSEEVWFALLTRLRRDLGYPALDRATFDRLWGQGVQADVEILFPRQTVDELSALYAAHFLDHVERLDVEAGGPPLVARLRAAGVATAVVTNTPQPLAGTLLARAGVAVDVVIAGTDAPRPKPWPDPVLLACERLGVAPARALMVGDTAYDAQSAAAAGAAFCGFGGIEAPLVASSLAEVGDMVLGAG